MGGRNSKPKQPKVQAALDTGEVDPGLLENPDELLKDLDKQMAAIEAGAEVPAAAEIAQMGDEADGDVTIEPHEVAELEEELANLDVEESKPVEAVTAAAAAATDSVSAAADTVSQTVGDAVAAVTETATTAPEKIMDAIDTALPDIGDGQALIKPLAG